jgi:hypothetical protein
MRTLKDRGTHILHTDKYGRLLAKTRPQVIRSDEDLERFTQLLLDLDERRTRPAKKNLLSC